MIWPPKPSRARGLLARYDHVPAEQPDLGPLVDGPAGDRLQGSPVGVIERFVERHGVARDGGDGPLLGLEWVVVGGGDDDAVARPPSRSVDEGKLLCPLRGGGRKARPALAFLAVDLQDAAHDAQHLGAHVHDVLGLVGARQEIMAWLAKRSAGVPTSILPWTMIQSDRSDQLLVLEPERAVDPEPVEPRRAGVEHYRLARGYRDGIPFFGDGAAPGCGVRPKLSLEARGAGVSAS